MLHRTDDGSVFSWGDGEYGKLGTGHMTNATEAVPVAMPDRKKIKHIASGPACSMLLSEEGELYGFGRNEFGQLGVGASFAIELSAMEAVPTRVADLTEPIIHVSCGQKHTVACTASGKVFQWGERLWLKPMAVKVHDSNRRIVQVAGGGQVTAALDDRGVLWVRSTSPHTAAPLSFVYVAR